MALGALEATTFEAPAVEAAARDVPLVPRVSRVGVLRATTGAPVQRCQALDACRGAAVVAMLFANFVNVFLHEVPNVLAHNRGNTFHLFDFPAPFFQFLSGVSLVLFLEKRRAEGLAPGGSKLAAVRRFFVLIGLGVLLDGIGSLQLRPRWGVLQTLGLGGLVATALANLPDLAVTAVTMCLLALFSGRYNGEVHGNPIAAIAFVPLTLAGMVLGRGLRRGRLRSMFLQRAAGVTTVGAVVAAGTYLAGVPFNKVLGTSSFAGLTGALSAAALLVTAEWEQQGRRFPAWLLALGRSALTAWVLQYVLVYYPAWLLFPTWQRLPLVPGLLAALVALTSIMCLTVTLGRRGVRVPL